VCLGEYCARRFAGQGLRAESAAVLADVTSDATKIEAVAVEENAGVGGPAVGEVPEYCTFGAAGDENRVHGVRSRPQNSSPEAALARAATRTWHNLVAICRATGRTWMGVRAH
jgi:hypothetical protein